MIQLTTHMPGCKSHSTHAMSAAVIEPHPETFFVYLQLPVLCLQLQECCETVRCRSLHVNKPDV